MRASEGARVYAECRQNNGATTFSLCLFFLLCLAYRQQAREGEREKARDREKVSEMKVKFGESIALSLSEKSIRGREKRMSPTFKRRIFL